MTNISGHNSIKTVYHLNLINSLPNWTLVDHQLTIDSNTKITVATFPEHTNSSLVVTRIENNTSTIKVLRS